MYISFFSIIFLGEVNSVFVFAYVNKKFIKRLQYYVLSDFLLRKGSLH